jgi:hypothetical protein
MPSANYSKSFETIKILARGRIKIHIVGRGVFILCMLASPLSKFYHTWRIYTDGVHSHHRTGVPEQAENIPNEREPALVICFHAPDPGNAGVGKKGNYGYKKMAAITCGTI